MTIGEKKNRKNVKVPKSQTMFLIFHTFVDSRNYGVKRSYFIFSFVFRLVENELYKREKIMLKFYNIDTANMF